MISLDEYQEAAKETAVYPKQGTQDGLIYTVLGLTGESGELANKLKKSLRSEVPFDQLILADELGDVLWYVALLAGELNFSLETIARMNLVKLSERQSKKQLKEHK